MQSFASHPLFVTTARHSREERWIKYLLSPLFSWWPLLSHMLRYPIDINRFIWRIINKWDLAVCKAIFPAFSPFCHNFCGNYIGEDILVSFTTGLKVWHPVDHYRRACSTYQKNKYYRLYHNSCCRIKVLSGFQSASKRWKC